jgi:plasmid replication initiation protein
MKQTILERFSKMSGLTEEEIQEAVNKPSNFDPKESDRHVNLDLFVCPSLLDLAPKADRVALEHPFFALSQHTNKQVFHYEHETKHGLQSVHITPSFYGNPLITDRDLLIFAISHLVKAANDGKKISKTIRFGIYDFIVTTNRSKGHTYAELENMLSRLRGCSIRTTIKTGGVVNTAEFGMIDSWRTEKHDESLKGQVEITLSDFLMRALAHKEVLTLSRDYFLISGNLKRRCYELARKFCGRQKFWTISLELLHKKSGSSCKSTSRFRQQIKKIAEDNDLPEYVMLYSKKKDAVAFFRRKKT